MLSDEQLVRTAIGAMEKLFPKVPTGIEMALAEIAAGDKQALAMLAALRAVAEAAVKDVKRSTLLEVIQLLNQSPYSLTKRECIDLVTALKMKVDNNEN